ncbi:dispersed gene family protein 1 (DGF-1) [Trypanosoma rangeli]|uniref:Dispersed gene family protein 1 (DGF-1) n=1 Tax=Trypanosoma rangeli TaxID=5698 RepID=A0A3S5IS23_TRYRA|nr:dispersed gene family protein 1 (DGF-1) [Trypanosoma rangeli]RNF09682.1 dispersed gene family protein 1 (DGF-1) [Trypanosoma rangeli]|eukprot:RNF09682.1 dispersed gene family protein 1 (DGF-1) [Trypanosoma rangeli]
MASGNCFLCQYYSSKVLDHSVMRMVGNSGPLTYSILAYESWVVRQSSWLDWRDNDVRGGKMFNPSGFCERRQRQRSDADGLQDGLHGDVAVPAEGRRSRLQVRCWVPDGRGKGVDGG